MSQCLVFNNLSCDQGVLGSAMAGQQKEYLQMYYLVLQVCYYLMVGQVKSVKPVLKQLQQSIQVSVGCLL